MSGPSVGIGTGNAGTHVTGGRGRRRLPPRHLRHRHVSVRVRAAAQPPRCRSGSRRAGNPKNEPVIALSPTGATWLVLSG